MTWEEFMKTFKSELPPKEEKKEEKNKGTESPKAH
jgi:hypothetical protein